jgi:hypothetical protein
MNELIDMKRMWKEFNEKVWAKSLIVVLMFLLGMMIGSMLVRNSVLDDCRFLSSFRIGDYAFSCVRR